MQIFEEEPSIGQKWFELLLQLLDIAKAEYLDIGHSWQNLPKIVSALPFSQYTFALPKSVKWNQ